eukprot:gene8234-8904_t
MTTIFVLFRHVIFFLCAQKSLGKVLAAVEEPTLLYEFISLNYTWDDQHQYNDYIQTGKFIPANNLLAGINVDVNGDIYLTVPRWRNGVPGTLNKLNTITKTLTPYPSWDLQIEGNTDYAHSLQNCQSMTIAPKSRVMWVIETGRRNFYASDKSLETSSPPGIWWIDLQTNQVIDQFYFPTNVIDAKNSFLNDIALDEVGGYAYFSDAWDKGAIIVYNHNDRSTYRYTGKSTQNDPFYSMVINGKNYGRMIFTTPIDGISISEDAQYVYYAQVQGAKLYRLPTSTLKNFKLSNAQMDKAVVLVGEKEPSDGIKYINNKLYWGALTTSNVHSVDFNATLSPDLTTQTVKTTPSAETLEWIDTFAIDHQTGGKYLYFVSNRLDQFSLNSMDFNGGKGANMRIFKVAV